MPAEPSRPTCDILLPVYNRPDAVRDLLESLAAHTDRDLLGRILVGDDGSDDVTQKILGDAARSTGLPIEIFRREKSLGFGANCNDLYERSEAKIVIILNSDVVVPPYWLGRMLAPFEADDTVALATPYATNAANHTIRMQPGQSWRDVDALLGARAPRFPDDCTAIGFCMAVDRSKLLNANIPLFDPAFGRGYGEDTDLHYRALEAGYRSVIVDNLCVFHEGGASFSALPDGNAIRDRGISLFFERWADRHAKDHAAFEASGTLEDVMDPTTHICRVRAQTPRLDALFVLPSSFVRYGGVWFVCRLIEHLQRRGYAASAFVQDHRNLYSDLLPFGFRGFEDEEDLKRQVSDIGCVVATSDATIGTAHRIAEAYGAREALFLQNMEICFRSGISIDTYRHYKQLKSVITVSEALKDYIRAFAPDADVRHIALGPDPLVFYPRNVGRKNKTVAVAMNAIPEKGFTHALETALMLKERGFAITFFGWDTDVLAIPEDIGNVEKRTDRDALAQLFSRTEFVIDHSYLEGLGLIALEAAFCGCVPITASKGAAEYLFQDGRDCIRLSGYKTLGRTLDAVAAMTPATWQKLSRNAQSLRDSLGLQQGCREFEEVLLGWGVLRTPARPE